MLNVVEMSWGEPHSGLIVERDDDGAITNVRVLRSMHAPDPQRRTFYCSGQVWYDSLDLARKRGWRPAGTVPADESREAWARAGRFDSSFKPRLRPYVKQVSPQDAANLAHSLERALGDPVEMAMLRVRLNAQRVREPLTPADRPLSSPFLRDFIAFLHRGPFVFAWRDL
jgi:hypothetical protein